MRFTLHVIASLVLAVALYFELFDPLYNWLDRRITLPFIAVVLFVLLLPLTWLALVYVGVRTHGLRGLWMLLGAPLALYRPYVVVTDFDGP
jgi:predicted PurR-regulated permease PerM